jgi:hypothetical protein
MKPGYKTTEGWLAAAAMMLSMLYGLGVLGTHQGAPDKIAAFIAAALTSAGYAVGRSMVKSAEASAPKANELAE